MTEAAVKRDVEGFDLPSAEDVKWANNLLDRIINNVKQSVIGKDEAIRSVMTAFCAGGHVLIEDHPGVGKTLLSRSFAQSLGVETGRIQYTPDVVPSDVTGSIIFSRKNDEFKFRPGPVFTNILLADEVNRGTPRTQSALLESMEEHAVTVDDVRYELPKPFLVIATQNPLEVHGTFPLPESQLDRFMMRLSMGYPSMESEDMIIRKYCRKGATRSLEPVAHKEDMLRLMDICSSVYIGENARLYLLKIVDEIRNDPQIKMGVSPRSTLSFAKAAQARALMHSRDSVLPDDLRELAIDVLSHRIIPHSHADNPEDLLNECLTRVEVPGNT